jgi:FkbM family methyltransferase
MCIAPRTMLCGTAYRGHVNVADARLDELRELCAAPGNARMARHNLEINGIDAEVVEAALGPEEGTARFEVAGDSTLGRLGDSGIEVPIVTPQSLVDRFPPGEPIDLVKMDVEGAERDVLKADLARLDRLQALAIEFHDGPEATAEMISRITEVGFDQIVWDVSDYMGSDEIVALLVRRNGGSARQAA